VLNQVCLYKAVLYCFCGCGSNVSKTVKMSGVFSFIFCNLKCICKIGLHPCHPCHCKHSLMKPPKDHPASRIAFSISALFAALTFVFSDHPAQGQWKPGLPRHNDRVRASSRPAHWKGKFPLFYNPSARRRWLA